MLLVVAHWLLTPAYWVEVLISLMDKLRLHKVCSGYFQEFEDIGNTIYPMIIIDFELITLVYFL